MGDDRLADAAREILRLASTPVRLGPKHDHEDYVLVPANLLGFLETALEPEQRDDRQRQAAVGTRCADHEHGGHGCHDRPHISIDPASYSGQPVICWRIPPEIPCAQWWYGHETVDGITENWPAVTKPRFLVAAWWLGKYGSRTWQKRWGVWSREAHGFLLMQDYEGCPLPPTRRQVQGEAEG